MILFVVLVVFAWMITPDNAKGEELPASMVLLKTDKILKMQVYLDTTMTRRITQDHSVSVLVNNFDPGSIVLKDPDIRSVGVQVHMDCRVPGKTGFGAIVSFSDYFLRGTLMAKNKGPEQIEFVVVNDTIGLKAWTLACGL
jgi:hypothetical protein